jgi:hypothetical protein
LDGDRLTAAFERHILQPQAEKIRGRWDRPTSMTIETNCGSYSFRTQDVRWQRGYAARCVSRPAVVLGER